MVCDQKCKGKAADLKSTSFSFTEKNEAGIWQEGLKKKQAGQTQSSF